jgi:histidinol-phosphatase
VYEEELAFANELADLAGEIGLGFFGGTFEVRLKPDRTPVTEADIAIETAIRHAVKGTYPDDGVLGEEGGSEGGGPPPLDRRPDRRDQELADGVQIWSNLIALASTTSPWSAW